MDPETLKEVGPALIGIACCGSLAVGIFALAGLLRKNNPHGRIEKKWEDTTVEDLWGLIKIGTKRFKVDGDSKTISGPKFK